MFNIYIPTSPRVYGDKKWESRLGDTICYLRQAGFDQKIQIVANPGSTEIVFPEVNYFYNKEKQGLSKNWKTMIEMSLQDNEPWTMIVEDDIACQPDSSQHIKDFISKIDTQVGFVSGYTPKAYLWSWPLLRNFKGWANINRGWNTWGTQCILMQKESAKMLLESYKLEENPIDAHIGLLFETLKLKCYYPVPSLFEHVGFQESCIHEDYSDANVGLRYGEQFHKKIVLP